MDNIQIKSAFIAVFDKKNLDSLIPVLKNLKVKVLGTEGTVKYLKARGIVAKSVVSGFDFDGRVKSLDRAVFARILADRTKKKHLLELSRIYSSNDSEKSKKNSSRFARTILPIDAVIVDLYKPDKKRFPESMDIGGQALIRAAIKNYKFVTVAFDKKSISDLAWEMKTSKGKTSLNFRKKQAGKALKFIAQRAKLEAGMFS